jgi:hypothetical protein
VVLLTQKTKHAHEHDSAHGDGTEMKSFITDQEGQQNRLAQQ